MKIENILFLSLLILTIGLSCRFLDNQTSDCDPVLVYPSANHYLKVPVFINPNKLVYRVGDTLSIKSNFSDSISDINFQQKFHIKEFPFRPFSALYVFYDDETWDYGFLTNDVLVDSIYKPVFISSNGQTDKVYGETFYNNGEYDYEIKIVFLKAGRYVYLQSDSYETYRPSPSNEHLNDEANSINFEGKCENYGFHILSIIEGDVHYNQFYDEMLFVDKNILGDKFSTLLPEHEKLQNDGSNFWEWNGTYCFEVIE